MSSLPGQLSATAPAFVPTPSAKTPRLVQRRRPARVAPPGLSAADKIWAPVSPSQGNWAVPAPSSNAYACAPCSAPRPQASYANALQADPAHKLASTLGLIRPSTRSDGQWQVSDPQEEALIAQIGSLLRTIGEQEARRLLLTAKVLLPQMPSAADVVQAIELVVATAPEHRQDLATLCYRMSSSGSGDRDSRLSMAHNIAAHAIGEVSEADHRLRRLYRTAGLPPLAASDHWKLCVGLMSLGQAAHSLDAKFTGPDAIDKSIWAGTLQQWLTHGPERWLEQLDVTASESKRSSQAHRLLIAACAEHCVCLPPSLEACIATFLASHDDDVVIAAQALETTARLLSPSPSDAVSARIWQAVSGLSRRNQAHLIALVETIYPSTTVKGDRMNAIEVLCGLPLAAAVEAHAVLQTLCAKAKTALPPSYQLRLVAGLTRLEGDMTLLQSVCHEPELDAESVAGLLAQLVELSPSVWLDEAQSRLLTAQEFVTVNMRDVPNAIVCGAPEDSKRQFRAFSVF